MVKAATVVADDIDQKGYTHTTVNCSNLWRFSGNRV